MKVRYIQQAVEALEGSRGFAPAQVVGCTSDEGAAMEALLPADYRLPRAYREFLLYGGRKMADVFRGVDISYAMSWALLSHGNRDVIAIARRSDPHVVLPPDLFALNEHFGDNFTFLRLSEGDDPPIYLWEEGGLSDVTTEHDTFSRFLLELVRQSIRHRGE